MEKYCSRCKTLKPVSDFNVKKRSKKDGLQTFCRSCNKTYMSERYYATKDVYAVKVRERRHKIRQTFNDLKSNLSCIRCGEDHPATLDFHHRDASEKEAGVADAVHEGWHIDRIKAEIAKCDVLCANCHRIHHWNEKNGAA